MLRSGLLDQDLHAGGHRRQARQKRDVDVGEEEDPARARRTLRPAPTSKYTHHRAATAAKPSIAEAADAGRQSLSAVPRATATTDSPKTISGNRANRSGTDSRRRG
jgi:hypothetical protein